MLHFYSSHKKSALGGFFLGLALVFAGLSFVGCNFGAETKSNDAKDIGAIEGKWLDASYGKSYYEISPDSFKNYGESLDGTPYESYEGKDVTVVYDEGGTSGTIFIKYTKAMNSDSTYSTDAPDVGKWYAISFKDLSASAVKISGALKAGGATSKEKLADAKAEFTVANGYFNFYSDCTKVE